MPPRVWEIDPPRGSNIGNSANAFTTWCMVPATPKRENHLVMQSLRRIGSQRMGCRVSPVEGSPQLGIGEGRIGARNGVAIRNERRQSARPCVKWVVGH